MKWLITPWNQIKALNPSTLLFNDFTDRNSLKTKIFHKHTIYEQHIYTSSGQKITFAGHEYGRVQVYRIKT